jgi:hypothetical protein
VLGNQHFIASAELWDLPTAARRDARARWRTYVSSLQTLRYSQLQARGLSTVSPAQLTAYQ